jgi:gliding motility-associated-like protein
MLSLFYVSAQKESNFWYFGQKAGLDFNSGSPVAVTDGQIKTTEGCASISDADGNLLFYTNGVTVYDASHSIMENGTGLLGDDSSTNSAIIIPKPDHPDIYYIFTVGEPWDASEGMRFSEVDMTLNGGLGGITGIKNVELLGGERVTEKLSAVRHANGTDYWVVGQEIASKSLMVFQVSSAGVNTTPIVNSVSDGTIGIQGVLKFSPNGKKLAMAITSYGVELFDFNAATGKIYNAQTLILYNPAIDFDDDNYYGLEFSPRSDILYASEMNSHVYQFNLKAGTTSDIMNSKLILATLTDYRRFGTLQLGPDGKIYIARRSSRYLDAITNPGVLGLGCTYVENAVSLDSRECELGLPPFIQSYFNVEAFDYENTCSGDSTKFLFPETVDSVTWDFNDPASGVNNISTDLEPTHVFSSPGVYNVSVTATVGGNTDTNEQEITIYQIPTATKPQNILTCDNDNDGFYNFDLTEQDATILNGQDPSVFEVVYYASMLDYANSHSITVSSDYKNTVAYTSESIVAAVKNRSNYDCDAITSFNILTHDIPKPNLNIAKLSFCDNTSVGTDVDGKIRFDLTQKENDILNGQLSTDFGVKYFTDPSFLNEIVNLSSYENTNRIEIIYVQVLNLANPLCTASTQFEIEVLELPVTTPIVDLKQCDNDLDGFSVFNLNEVIDEITTNATSEIITFHETLVESNSNTNPIANTTTYTNEVVSADVIWARIENIEGCYRSTQVNLIVSTTQIPSTFTRDFYECDDDLDGDTTNGISEFDFSSINSEIEAIFPVGQQLIIKYYKNEIDALAESNPILNTSNYRNDGAPNVQDIFIRVDSALNNDCLGLGNHITLHVEKQPVAYPVAIPEQCDDDGDTMYAFDTTNIESSILNGQKSMDVSYTDELGNALTSPLPNPFLTASQTITARVTNTTSQDSDGACFDETKIDFRVDAASIAYPIDDMIECDDDIDGAFPFNTSNIEANVLNGQTGMNVIYTDENGNNLPSPLPDPFLSTSQAITVRVENPLSNICFDETTFKLVVVEQPVLNMSDTWLICEDDSVDIIADSGYDEYLWLSGENTPVITVYTPGTYQVTATNIYDGVRCETSKTIIVVESNVATITNIETKDWTQNDNVITVFVDGLGDYEYSLDGVVYQNDNSFNSLNVDNYTVYVRDKKGCGVIEKDVFLMYYPKFFTPNNDGHNDRWQVYNSNLEPNNKIYIYNRYGKLIKELSPNEAGWDGTIKGEMMPVSDYWFVVDRQNGKQYRGHFTLKR